MLAGIVACFTLSGFAALLYQTAWLRQLSIAFGTSELAVATILAAYMGGLALGAAVSGRYAHRIKRPVLVYGILEAGIAVSALCVPLLMGIASSLYQFLLGDQPQPVASQGLLQPAFYLVSTFVIIAIPTGLMGATLPILIKQAVASDQQIGPRIGLLYAMNTVGAVAGALATGFILLPAMGLSRTIWVGVFVNVCVFLIAAAMSRWQQSDGADSTSTTLQKSGTDARFWILPIILLSGANAFFYEVLWTRLLTHVIGGSVHAFATMLASFLAGIAIGGGLAGRFASSRERAACLFAGTQVAIAVFSGLVYYWLQNVSPAPGGLTANAGLAVLTMLPATIFIGATFPFAVRILATDTHSASRASARIYAWNTAGAIIGAIAAGFFLIQALGFGGSIRLAVAVNLSLALLCLALLTRVDLRKTAVLAVLFLSAVILYQPSRPDAVITASPVNDQGGGTEIFYAVGRAATVLALDQDDGIYLRSNGLPEATISRRGAPPNLLTQSWLTALPVITRPAAESLLLIGLGGGVAIENIPPSIKLIDVIELEPEIIAANLALSELRQHDPLADPRVNITINDARNAIRLTSKRYGIIVSQPSHPWTAGASHLYTREFMQLAREHLHEDGVFVQWMSTEFVDEFLLRSLATTLRNIFEHVRLYRPGPDVLVFLASPQALDVERGLIEIPQNFSQLGLNSVEDLLAALTLDTAGIEALSAGVPENSDDMNRLATSRLTLDSLPVAAVDALLQSSDTLLQDSRWLHAAGAGEFNPVYVGYKLLRSGFTGRAIQFAETMEPSDRLTIIGLSALIEGKPADSDRLFEQALIENKTNHQAQYALIRNHLTEVARGSASNFLLDIADDLPNSASATVSGWRHALKGEWDSLATLDSRLAQARTTDLWFSEAARLRAEWRLRSATPGDRSLEEALRIVDQSLALYEIEELYLLRAAIAVGLQNPYVLVETAVVVEKSLSNRIYIKNQKNLPIPDAPRILALSNWFTDQLSKDYTSPVAARAGRLQEKFRKLAGEISAD